MASRLKRCERNVENHGPCGICKVAQSNETEHYVMVRDNEGFEMRCAACTAAYVLANGSEQ